MHKQSSDSAQRMTQGMIKVALKDFHSSLHELAANTPQWRAAITENPLVNAFEDTITTHPGIGAAPVDANEMPSRLEKLTATPRNLKSSAYFHIPYCETRCLYCMFYNKPYRNADESRLFTDYLIKEMQLWADKAVMTGRPIRTVYFGGGTPTALEAKDIERLLQEVRQRLPLANDCEITFEGRLSNFGEDRMQACLKGGVNRFSLGVQSFDTKTRQAVGRRSTKEQLISQLQKLQSYDNAAVVIDLIYGFPYQTMQTWEEDLQIAQALNLDGVDCYQLRVFPGAPLHKYIANGKLPAGPGHELRAQMFARSVELMQAAQWRRLSISHWASGTRERNFYNYFAKTRTDCLSFGPGAGGTLHAHAYMMERNVDNWMSAIDEGRKPIAMLLEASPRWHLYKAVSEHLELNRLNPKVLEHEFNVPLTSLWAPLLENWLEAGLLEREGDFYLLSIAGQFWQTRLTQLLLNQIRS